MRNLRYGILSMMMIMLTSLTSYGAFQNETLKYVIQYKWGLVHKDAGDATLSLRNNGSNYNITMTGKTRPWADKIFMVRDTLKGVVKKDGFRPVSYTKITHEDKYYAKDEITYTWAGNTVQAVTNRVKVKKGKTTKSSFKFTGGAPAFDMLSIFYYLRNVDYNTFTKGKSLKVTMFSGKKKETLTFRNLGKETIKLRDKSKREAYKIGFSFTENKKSSSDAMEVWISADSRHIPLLIVGKLSIGEVRAYYVGG